MKLWRRTDDIHSEGILGYQNRCKDDNKKHLLEPSGLSCQWGHKKAVWSCIVKGLSSISGYHVLIEETGWDEWIIGQEEWMDRVLWLFLPLSVWMLCSSP